MGSEHRRPKTAHSLPPVPCWRSDNPKERCSRGGMRVDNLSLDLIFPNPNQPRKVFDETALAELAASIRERGVMEPIVVRPKDGKYGIVAGERRYRASKLAGLTEIPVVGRELSDEDAAAAALLGDCQRGDRPTGEKGQG